MPSIEAHVQAAQEFDLLGAHIKCSSSSETSSRGASGGRGMLWDDQRGWTGHCCRVSRIYPRTIQIMLRGVIVYMYTDNWYCRDPRTAGCGARAVRWFAN